MRKYLDIENGSGKRVSDDINKIYSLLNNLKSHSAQINEVVAEIRKLLDLIGEEMDDGTDWGIDEYR